MSNMSDFLGCGGASEVSLLSQWSGIRVTEVKVSLKLTVLRTVLTYSFFFISFLYSEKHLSPVLFMLNVCDVSLCFEKMLLFINLN